MGFDAAKNKQRLYLNVILIGWLL